MLAHAPNLPISAETEIAAPTFDLDLADQHPATVPHVDPIPARRVQIAEDIALQAIGRARIGIAEDALVGQEGGVVLPHDRVGVHRGGAAVIGRAIPVHQVGVADVDGVFVRREGQARRSAEPIGHHPDIARDRVEAVDQLGQLRLRAEAALVAVDGVGEPDGSIGVDDHVVGAVEGTGVVVVQQGDGLVRALGFHVDQAGGFAQGALSAEDEAIAVVGAATGHVVALGASDLIACKVGGGEKLDFGDDDGFLASGHGVRGGVFNLIGGEEEGVGGWVEDASFVEVGGPRVVDEEL